MRPPAPTIAEARALDPQELHDRWCHGGGIYVLEDEYEVVMDCPVCKANRELAAARAAFESSGVGGRYLDVTWDELEVVDPLPALRSACDRIREVVASGHNALLVGPPGAGKTQAAALLVRAAIYAGFTAVLENLGRAAMNVRAGYSGEGDSESVTVSRLSRVDLLVLDDVGAGEAGDGKVEKRVLYFVMEARQNARKPTALTSNLTAQQLKEFLGERVVNRLMPLEVFAFSHGRNFRAPKGGTAWLP